MRPTALLLALIALAACASNSRRPTRRGPGDSTDVAPRAAPNTTAHADLRDADGRAMGTITLTQGPRGVIVSGDVTGLTPGAHAIHVHDSGRCEATFTSAGGHFNPSARAHGFKASLGSHFGDMPNIMANSAGTAHVEYYSPALTLAPGMGGLFDGDGASIIVHAGPDDYASDPAGNSGNRIACGVITR